MSQYQLFKSLHRKGDPLLVGNAWNTQSALLFQQNGYKAIATSSSAVAISLGYEDGEQISFDELFFILKRMIAPLHVPLTVDVERGYSEDIKIVIENIDRLVDIGVAGINLEDSIADKKAKSQVPINQFSKKLSLIKEHLLASNRQLFINARTDAYLMQLPDALGQTLKRAEAYEHAGADGIFVPFLKETDDMKKVADSTNLPLNVMFMDGLPNFDALGKAGVGRISMASALFRTTYAAADDLIRKVVATQSADILFKH